MEVFLGVAALLLLLTFGLPVAFSLLVSGAFGITMLVGPDLLTGILTTSPLSSLQVYAFVAIPMFILMANFIVASGVSEELFDIARIWMGRTPGGLAHATVLTGAAFGAISGSSTAAAATLSSTSIPGMIKQGYDKRLATGVAAISGTLAMLIPPSVAMVFYALIADLSVSELLISGLIPGALVTLTIMMTIAFLVALNPAAAPASTAFTLKDKILSMKSAWAFIVLFLLVTGSIYLGIATPTETSAIGALSALILCVFRRVPVRKLVAAFISAAEASCMIALIVVCAQVFGYFVTLSHVTQDLMTVVGTSDLNRWTIFTIVVAIYLVLGCFMDLVTMLIITVPVVVPLMTELGFDPYWFAIITIIAAEIGMVTPPLGFNVFVISKYTGFSVSDIFRGSYPHVLAHLLLIALLAVFPALVTWLPSTMN